MLLVPLHVASSWIPGIESMLPALAGRFSSPEPREVFYCILIKSASFSFFPQGRPLAYYMVCVCLWGGGVCVRKKGPHGFGKIPSDRRNEVIST